MVVAVVLGQPLDLADVAVVGAHLRLARALDGGLDAAHHGGVRGKRHVRIHERARPRRVGRGAGGVLHHHVHASQLRRRGLVGHCRTRQHRQQARRKHERQEHVQRAAHAFLLFLHFPSFRFLVSCFLAPRLCGARPLCVPVVGRTPLRTPFMQRAFARATLLRCAHFPHRKEMENASSPEMGSLAFLRNHVRFARRRGFAALPLRLNCSRVMVGTLAGPRCWRFTPAPTETEVRLVRFSSPRSREVAASR